MRKTVRVLFQNRDPKLWTGGDMFHMNAVKSALAEEGVNAEFSSDSYADLDNYDIVQLWNLTTPWTYAQFLNAKLRGKKVVISCIYIPNNALAKSHVIQMFKESDGLIFSTEKEIEVAENTTGIKIDRNKTIIAPLSCSMPIADSSIDKDKKRLVLYAGRIEPAKNLFLTILACRALDLPLMIAGQVVDGEYASICRRINYKNAVYLGNVTHEQLIKAYDAASVFVQPSRYETWGLATMEALHRRCRCVYTDYGNAFFGFSNVERCNPKNYRDIMDKIEKQTGLPFDDSDIPKLKELSWKNAAIRIKELYENIHNHSDLRTATA